MVTEPIHPSEIPAKVYEIVHHIRFAEFKLHDPVAANDLLLQFHANLADAVVRWKAFMAGESVARPNAHLSGLSVPV